MTKNMKTMDGNHAAAYASYAFTEVAAVFPITPSTPMAELVDEWAAQEKKNLFGQPVRVVEMQNEKGAAGAVHGSLQAGALTTTYTASQGLLLMIPNMYKMAGEFLPAVFHVSARAIAAHALSIFGDHQDVMAVRQTGYAMLSSASVQECMDLAFVAHLCAIKGRVPFVHFFDGFRTSHELQKIELINYEDIEKIVDYDAIQEFRNRSLNPHHPVERGSAQNPDIYFQGREAGNRFYQQIPDLVEQYMNEIKKITGREYHPFDYYGDPQAEKIIIAMGSVCETIEEVVDYLRANGEKVGILKVHLYRPFSEKYFMKIFPQSVKKVTVLDRTKEPGSLGEPLYQDIVKVFYDKEIKPVIVGGRYGLGSKDTTPSQILSVFKNMNELQPKNGFTIGIVDDVTNTSLPITEEIIVEPEGTINCRFWGLGSDGTVGANKTAIKMIGDHTDMHVQGYFSYDSKKSGGYTISDLRFGKKPIRSTYLINNADYVACHNQTYVNLFDLTNGLKKNGTFVLNCRWNEQELEDKLPSYLKRYIANNQIQFYTIDAVSIAGEIGLGNRINMIMQSAFFKLSNIIPIEDAIKYLKDSVSKSYGKKGEKIVNMNWEAIDRGVNSLTKINVPQSWSSAEDNYSNQSVKEEPDFIDRILRPMSRLKGDDLPVSAFKGMEDGTFPCGTTAYEKRGIAPMVPEWQVDKCTQCNHCAFICPHAVIRPFLISEEEITNAPSDTFVAKKTIGKGEIAKFQFRIQVSPLDCTGCGNCADICPAPGKALIMKPAEEQIEEQSDNWEYASKLPYRSDLMDVKTLKGSQFKQPLFEFHGACPGCGETANIKLLTQLFGERMMIANATGCSSIYGGSVPSFPYTKNHEGNGPSWGNSLFEDNAEYGFGMYLGVKQIRARLSNLMNQAMKTDIGDELKEAFKNWIETMDKGDASSLASKNVLEIMESTNYKGNKLLEEIMKNKDYLVKKSQWIIGGDGWAYDIDSDGLDHILAMGEDVNILVMDTEVYSNTGGQSSKATQASAVAKFAAAGKRVRKKDLGMMAINYGHVYVAQIAMGANMTQTVKAMVEAEAYPGPSIIIAYTPCINHGIKTGMGTSVAQEKKAVDAGYWHLWRYNPLLKEQGKNPFILDSKEPTKSFREHLESEIRYTTLKMLFPEIAEELYEASEKHAKERFEMYKRFKDMKF
ncbi:MAG: nifJ [Bacillales bacterium]|nr:nifJ [Bacillales bacterium]